MREELQPSPEHSSSRENGMSREGEKRMSAVGGGGRSAIPGGERERLGRARGAARDGNLPL